jgi:type VI secretion system protein ImpC
MAETDTQQAEGKEAALGVVPDEFSALLQQEFKPKTERTREAVTSAVQTLAEQVLKETSVVSDDAVETIEGIIAEIDRKLTEQVNLILHHEQFQKLEGTWRGLHYLVNNTETDEMLKIRVMNISKQELGKNLKKFKGTAWDQSPIFKKVYEEEYGQFGGEPYGCLIGDYHFDQSPPDVELLTSMSKVAAASHPPSLPVQRRR